MAGGSYCRVNYQPPDICTWHLEPPAVHHASGWSRPGEAAERKAADVTFCDCDNKTVGIPIVGPPWGLDLHNCCPGAARRPPCPPPSWSSPFLCASIPASTSSFHQQITNLLTLLSLANGRYLTQHMGAFSRLFCAGPAPADDDWSPNRSGGYVDYVSGVGRVQAPTRPQLSEFV